MGMKTKTEQVKELTPIPELPTTTVNPQPRDEASPVRKAEKLNGNVKTGLNEVMSKADWAAKDRGITITALIKSVLESPVVAQMVHGKDDGSVLQTITKVFDHVLNLYGENK